jgi:hypothetical protein
MDQNDWLSPSFNRISNGNPLRVEGPRLGVILGGKAARDN